MNLQAKLTLGYVLLVVVLVSSISAVDLINNMEPSAPRHSGRP
jgi:hypothetical protein